MKITRILLSIVTLAFLAAGCQSDIVDVADEATEPAYALSKVGRPMIWADGHLFRSIATPAVLPVEGPFDILYNGNFANYDGMEPGHISDAKPGDQDYNGGRWKVMVLKAGVDPNKYHDADSADDLDPNDFMSAGVYFECPLLPYNGKTNPQGPKS